MGHRVSKLDIKTASASTPRRRRANAHAKAATILLLFVSSSSRIGCAAFVVSTSPAKPWNHRNSQSLQNEANIPHKRKASERASTTSIYTKAVLCYPLSLPRQHHNDALLDGILRHHESDSLQKKTRRAAADLSPRIDSRYGVERAYPTATRLVPPRSSTILRVAASSSDDSNQRVGSKTKKRQLFAKEEELTDSDYKRRKLQWAARYTDVDNLRRTLGSNRNKLWGDFDPETTRKLYHTHLPRALLGLYELGLMRPQDLAPLAYEARNAAKKYAFDGFRSWKNYGKWNVEGMSWEQIWLKYEKQIIDSFQSSSLDGHGGEWFLDEDEVETITTQICLKILERSCVTNEAIDRLFLGTSPRSLESVAEAEGSLDAEDEEKKRRRADRNIKAIARKLDRDMHELLYAPAGGGLTNPFLLAKELEVEQDGIVRSVSTKVVVPIRMDTKRRKRSILAPHEIFALRLLALTKRRLKKLTSTGVHRSGAGTTKPRQDRDNVHFRRD